MIMRCYSCVSAFKFDAKNFTYQNFSLYELFYNSICLFAFIFLCYKASMKGSSFLSQNEILCPSLHLVLLWEVVVSVICEVPLQSSCDVQI